MGNKNIAVLEDFTAYCFQHPEERFWQALRNWSGRNFIVAWDELSLKAFNARAWQDTFYWTGRNG